MFIGPYYNCYDCSLYDEGEACSLYDEGEAKEAREMEKRVLEEKRKMQRDAERRAEGLPTLTFTFADLLKGKQ